MQVEDSEIQAIRLTGMVHYEHQINMTDIPTTELTLSFDPGAMTGFAALNQASVVLVTLTLTPKELETFVDFLLWLPNPRVVVEQGPEYGHHSPITRKVERMLLEAFPSAVRVQPNRWKSHPVFKKRVHIPRRLVTAHEHDAVRLGQWFIATGEYNEESTDTARSHQTSTRHKRK